ncbi:hypothetical protein OGAPHI_004268 [Ogataea philodendri]|uniref:Uncharacterized protein n=1 Tax=Ogataea philodendri TaxID=1378263 RepID=A0A9P8T595_9ASCO|nr:uncharacterized protein OGAPHI_004268 [Ogataea philodendri]KAH3666079.1 hypothetical protein OGAPHI_004268 [Ogataea philodendri]
MSWVYDMVIALDAFSRCRPMVERYCITNPAIPTVVNSPHCIRVCGICNGSRNTITPVREKMNVTSEKKETVMTGCALKPITLIAHVDSPVPKHETSASHVPKSRSPGDRDSRDLLPPEELLGVLEAWFGSPNMNVGLATSTTPNSATIPQTASNRVYLSFKKR